MATRQDIAELLFREWDPIGAHDVAPRDEYVAYADTLREMLACDASADAICAYLSGVRTGWMKLPADRRSDRRAAALLHALGRR